MIRRARRSRIRAKGRESGGRPPADHALVLALLLDLVAEHGTGRDAHGRARHPATAAALAHLVPTAADEPARAALAARLVLRPLARGLLRTVCGDGGAVHERGGTGIEHGTLHGDGDTRRGGRHRPGPRPAAPDTCDLAG